MHKRTTTRHVTYKEGPQVRANGGTKANAPRDLDKGPQIKLPEEDKDELLPGGVSRPPGSAEPGLHPIQMHFDVACPLLLLTTFHICIWREPTLKTIKGASLHLSPHTPTHLSFISPSYPCSSVPLGVLHLVVYLEKRRRVRVEERRRSWACRNLLSFHTSTDLLQLELLPGYLPIFLKLLFV